MVETFVTGIFQENCYIAACEETTETMIVDPGDEAEDILAALERLGLTAKLIVITHEHMDHIGAITPVREATKASVRAPCPVTTSRNAPSKLVNSTPPVVTSHSAQER
jgi:glyoxylase-like metal-dependent hydrolase (beta-lactamase superfamily II)